MKPLWQLLHFPAVALKAWRAVENWTLQLGRHQRGQKILRNMRNISFASSHQWRWRHVRAASFLYFLLDSWHFFKDFFKSRISFSIVAFSNCNGDGKRVLLFLTRDRNLDFFKFLDLFLFGFHLQILIFWEQYSWLSTESSHGRPKLQTLSAFFVISSLVVSIG